MVANHLLNGMILQARRICFRSQIIATFSRWLGIPLNDGFMIIRGIPPNAPMGLESLPIDVHGSDVC